MHQGAYKYLNQESERSNFLVSFTSTSTSLQLLMHLSTRSDAVPIDFSILPGYAEQLAVAQPFLLAVLTILIYDAIITFDKEVKYFWKIPRAAVDFIYFLNRYTGIYGAIIILPPNSYNTTLLLCNFSHWTRDLANLIVTVSIDYVLMLRVLALYSQDARLSICLKLLLAVEALSTFAFATFVSLKDQIAVGEFPNHMRVCGANNLVPWQLAMIPWLIPATYGTFLMILAVRKSAEYWSLSAGFKGYKLVKVLVKDQAIYFLLVISSAIFNILTYKVRPSNLFIANLLGLLGNSSFLSLLGSRMLINMKEVGERGANGGGTTRTYGISFLATVSEMDFTEPVNSPTCRGCECEAEGSDWESCESMQ